MRNPVSLKWLSALMVGVVGCNGNPTSPVTQPAVANVVPSGGSAGVPTGASITVTFTRSMQPGMELYAALHEGSVGGAVAQGSWMWSGDHTRLTFTPTAPLQAQSIYVLHLGGGMVDAGGMPIDFQSCVGRFGGAWATPAMMGGGMMGDSTMMGPGWQGPNGMYGMTFTFTTS